MTESEQLRQIISDLDELAEVVIWNTSISEYERLTTLYRAIRTASKKSSSLVPSCAVCGTPMQKRKADWHCEGCGRNQP